jgi:hypothetical protein
MFALFGWLIEKAFLAIVGLIVIILLVAVIGIMLGQQGDGPACAQTDSCASIRR